MTFQHFRKINKVYFARFLLYWLQGALAYIFWEIGAHAAAMVMLLLSGFMARTTAYEERRKLWRASVETCVAIKIATSGGRPRALVLCGGGGKGAYQLGALRALAEAKVTFDLITGSSIGALNAALVLSNGIDKARQLFAVELGQMFRLSLRSLLIGLLRILSVEGRYLSIKRSGRLRKAAGFILASVGILLFLPEQLDHGLWGFWMFFFCVLMSTTFVPTYLTWGVWLACEHWNWAALSEARLAKLIKENIDERQIAKQRTRLVVTVARETEVPPRPEFGTGEPGPVYVPEYIQVSEAYGELHHWLLASASVPFGVLPHVRKGEEVYVDGGLVDNAPILPALEAGCQEIIVIHTNPEGTANGQRITSLEGLTAHLSRCLVLRDLGSTALETNVQVPRLLESLTADTQRFQSRIVHIRPSESTGSLIGSLLFGGKRFAEHLDNLGYRDAVAVLASSDLAEWVPTERKHDQSGALEGM